MTNIRCWLFGHEWIEARRFPSALKAIFVCPRCGDQAKIDATGPRDDIGIERHTE